MYKDDVRLTAKVYLLYIYKLEFFNILKRTSLRYAT